MELGSEWLAAGFRYRPAIIASSTTTLSLKRRAWRNAWSGSEPRWAHVAEDADSSILARWERGEREPTGIVDRVSRFLPGERGQRTQLRRAE